MKAFVAAVVMALATVATSAQELTSSEIANAIEQGRAGKTLQKKCGATGENGFDIVIEGPVGRLMRAARDAARQHKTFATADVTPELSRAVLTVSTHRDHSLTTASLARERAAVPGYVVVPDNSASQLRADRPFEFDVQIRHKDSPAGSPAVQRPLGRIKYFWQRSPNQIISGPAPSTSGPVPSTTPGPGSDMEAIFDLAAFMAIPSGDVDVVVFASDAGQRRCGIYERDRKALR